MTEFTTSELEIILSWFGTGTKTISVNELELLKKIHKGLTTEARQLEEDIADERQHRIDYPEEYF